MPVCEPETSTSLAQHNPRLPTARPFRRHPVRGLGADVFIEHAIPNTLGPHRHDTWQLSFVPPGAAVEVAWQPPEGKLQKKRIVGGEIWLLPPGWLHHAKWREPFELIVLYLATDWVRQFFPALREESSIGKLTEHVAAMPVIADLCCELRKHADMPNGPTDWRVGAAGSHLAAVTLQAHLMLDGGVYRPPSALAGSLLVRLRQHVNEQGHERVSLANLAEGFGVSARHLRRIFRDSTGMSPQEWLMTERVKRAVRLLLDGCTIKAVVAQSGFTSESHMHRTIFRVYGCSPAAFRKQAQAAAIPNRA